MHRTVGPAIAFENELQGLRIEPVDLALAEYQSKIWATAGHTGLPDGNCVSALIPMMGLDAPTHGHEPLVPGYHAGEPDSSQMSHDSSAAQGRLLS
jgi:hypothetical protein